VSQFAQRGFVAEAIPAELLADQQLALGVSAHVATGRIKMSAAAQEKMGQLPLGASLTFRGGDALERDPLRHAIALGIAAGLNLQGGWR
jgi:hypothetical protein